MNEKFNTFDHLDKLKCVENDDILLIEKNFDCFTINIGYNYANEIINKTMNLPNLNINFEKLISFSKSKSESINDLTNEISLFNSYFNSLTKWVNLSKTETIKEKSIIYYLFYFFSRCFFYIIMHNDFIASKQNAKIFTKFFNNFMTIIKSAQLYLEEDISGSSIIIEDQPNDNIFEEKSKLGVLEAFSELKKYPKQFMEIITKCQQFLTLVQLSVEERIQFGDNEEEYFFDKEMFDLLEIFVISFNILHDINKNYSIIDYRYFYNDGISKNFKRRDLYVYLKNEKIREKLKNKVKKDDEGKKGKKDIPEFLEDFEDYSEDKIEFTLFDYMWLFNPSAKYDIIRLFNYKRKRDSNRNNLYRRDDHENFLDSLFNRYRLPLNVRRDHLIEDTLNEVSKPEVNLQGELKVKFRGEQGVDAGGIRKEFFILLVRQLFDIKYGMFSYNEKTRLYWFNHYTFEPKIKYELIGIIFGLAIYNNTILDVKLPLAIYKKLLNVNPTLEDLRECDPELYKNLKFLKDTNDENLKENLDSTFTVMDDKFGEKIIIPLKPNGENIMVDFKNKDEFVNLYLDWYFNKSINEYFNSFEKGFYKVLSRNLTEIINADELELILCGTQLLDFNELKLACKYEEYNKDSVSIKILWKILLEFNEEEKKKFLSFVTGCDRAPIDGLRSLEITITNGGSDINKLPSAHTCFNNFILPDYKNYEKMKKAILTAINYSEGFGLI